MKRTGVTLWTDPAPRPARPPYYVSPADKPRPIVDPAEHERWNVWFCLVLAAAIGAVAVAAVLQNGGQ